MREVLERSGEGQIIGLCSRGEDTVHPWFFCNKKREKKEATRIAVLLESVIELHPFTCLILRNEVIQADAT